jgi:hypothetical protein
MPNSLRMPRILALEIAGPDAAPELQSLAQVIAESQIDLKRVRQTRHYVIAGGFDDPLLLTYGLVSRHEAGESADPHPSPDG